MILFPFLWLSYEVLFHDFFCSATVHQQHQQPTQQQQQHYAYYGNYSSKDVKCQSKNHVTVENYNGHYGVAHGGSHSNAMAKSHFQGEVKVKSQSTNQLTGNYVGYMATTGTGGPSTKFNSPVDSSYYGALHQPAG